MPVRPETNVRLTDIVGDRVLERLGNTGNELLADTLDRLHQMFGSPVEVLAEKPPTRRVSFTAGVYQLPDGRRLASLKSGALPQLTAGFVNFTLGTISAVSNTSFVLPTVGVTQFIRAMIQFNLTANGVFVTFGAPAASLAAATIPAVLADCDPVAIVDLYSPAGGVGVFDVLPPGAITLIADYGDFDPDPVEQTVTVVTPQSVFPLTLVIPAARQRLSVFVNGLRQIQPTHYAVTGNSQVTFSEALPGNAEVLFRVE